MNLLPFGKLPAHKPRKFVPQKIDLGDWPQIAPLFGQLESRAPQIKNAGGLFAIFESLRGWCLVRACGIKTKF
jgi:hypothetical protein